MSKEQCFYCIKRKTEYCPNTSECYFLDNLPYFQTTVDVLKENQELKKQLEEQQDFINKLQSTKDKLDKWDRENVKQQKEFIELLEKEIVDSKSGSGQQYYAKEHLLKFKEIIGVKNEN